MPNVITEDWAFREVFATEDRAENAAAAAERSLNPTGRLQFDVRFEGKLGPWAYVVVRDRVSRELVGYLGPAGEP